MVEGLIIFNKMSDQLKLIVSELQKPPYSRNYNIITFDSLSGEQLLQVLNDVIDDIDNKHEMDISHQASWDVEDLDAQAARASL